MTALPEPWLRGPIDGIPPPLQPVAHALLQAREEIEALVPEMPSASLWTRQGAASEGYHLLHIAGALDRLFTYARGESLSDEQKNAARAEAQDHPDLDAATLARRFGEAVDAAFAQLRGTDPHTLLDDRKVGRAGLPSNVLGLLFHAAEHSSRHAGQLTTTVKLRQAADEAKA